MVKLFKIILINLLLIIVALFTLEVIIWGVENTKIKLRHERIVYSWPVKFHSGVKQFFLNLNYFPDEDKQFGRFPVGVEYKKPPIVLFGCSFAFGFELQKEQSFHYKLSNLTKRPVYNRACSGWGIQQMLYQVRMQDFYSKVPEPEYVMYMMIADHFRRLYVLNFLSGQLLFEQRNLRYKLKDGNLVQITDKNKYLNILKRLYITSELHNFYVNNFILSKYNYKNYFNFALEHFIESRNEMQKHWKNSKYVVILYQDFYKSDEFIKMLQNNGFKVLFIPSMTDVNLRAKEYNISDGCHPNEKAWDLLTPLVINKLDL